MKLNYNFSFVLIINILLIIKVFGELIEWDPNHVHEFVGTVDNRTHEVTIYPDIKIKLKNDESICSFVLTGEKMLPFLVEILSSKKGTGKMVVISPLVQDEYRFRMKGKLCGSGQFSREVDVDVQVIQGIQTPSWEKNVYDTEIQDDLHAGSKVMKIRAYEKGKKVENKICDYRITAPIDAPFDIDGNGVIRTTDKLDANKQKNYVLRVSAFDCWFPKSHYSSVSVNIRVTHACKFGWNGLFDQINYEPGSGLRFFHEVSQSDKSKPSSSLKFDFCDRPQNNYMPSDVCSGARPLWIAAKIRLDNSHQKRCEFDTTSVAARRKLCGVNPGTVNLLPSTNQFIREGFGEADVETGIYTFDGRESHWEVPSNVVSPDHFLGSNYTIMFWMKHSGEQKEVKQQILCNSDGDGKNRHHYSIYIHNCKLIILSRWEPLLSNKNEHSLLTPAEWRFKSPEFCDNSWHHYSINLATVSMRQTPERALEKVHEVDLFIDGRKFMRDFYNLEIVDDVRMHTINSVHFTKLVIGACWHAQTKSFNQYFQGQLSDLSILRGQSESSSVIQCINQCQERLSFVGFESMASSTSISINSDMDTMIVQATNTRDLGQIVDKIGYINSRFHPIPGKRTVTISTSIICSNDKEQPYSPNHQIAVVVLGEESSNEEVQKKYPIRISGQGHFKIKNETDVSKSGNGLAILQNVKIVDENSKQYGSVTLLAKSEVQGQEKEFQLDGASMLESCAIYPTRSFYFPQERLIFSNDVIIDLANQGIRLSVTNDSHGLVIDGRQSTSVYQFILRRIIYYNDLLSNEFDRSFKVTCTQGSSLDEISNTLTIKVTISEKLRQTLIASQDNLKSAYHVDLDIGDQSNNVQHHAQSDLMKHGLKKHDITDKVKMNYSNTVIIISVVALIIVAIFVMGLLRTHNNHGLWGHGNHHRLSTVFSGLSSSLTRIGGHGSERKVVGMRKGGPWVRLRQDKGISSYNSGFGGDNRRGERKDDDLQITINPILDYEKNLKLFKKFIGKQKSDKSKLIGLSDNQSLDELPDEYDGESEDFQYDNTATDFPSNQSNLDYDDEEDRLTIEDDDDDDVDDDDEYSSSASLSYDNHHHHHHHNHHHNRQHPFYQTGGSWSYQTRPTNENRSINIHSNPRYSFDNGFHA